MVDLLFDIVSKVDWQEVDNVFNQVVKELVMCFDFCGIDIKIVWKGDEVVEFILFIEECVKVVVDVFKEKLICCDILLKVFEVGELQVLGKMYKVIGVFKQGISSENVKKIIKFICDVGFKNVKIQIQGDEVWVISKKCDDLQVVIVMLKKVDLDVVLQFVNYCQLW